MNGIFEKPKYNTVINDYVAPNPNEIAKAIARNYHWCIYPAGNTALNILGLSTQVSNNWEYISDGRYVSYKFPSLTIRFKHRTNKEVTNLSSITAIFIEALKTLGKNNVNDNIINKLKRQLSVDDKKTLLKEGKEATDWIYDIIKKIQTENI